MVAKAVCRSTTSGTYSQVSDWSLQNARTLIIYPPTPSTGITSSPIGNFSFVGETVNITWQPYTQCPTGTTFKEYSIRKSDSIVGNAVEVATTTNTSYSWTTDANKASYFVFPRCETRFTSGTNGYITKTIYTIIPVAPAQPTANSYVWSKAAASTKTITMTNGCAYNEAGAAVGVNTKYATSYNTVYRVNPDGSINTMVSNTIALSYTPSTANWTALANGTYKYYYTQYCKSSTGVNSPTLTSPQTNPISITN